MNPLRHLLRRLRRRIFRRQAEAEMAEEMQFHLDQRAADYAAEGTSDTEARYAAQRKFGNVGSIQEYARDARGWSNWDRWRNDLRCAFRQLASHPGFTLLAIVTLGLGIGANTSMFSILNGILLKPLPYPESAQLERLYRVTAQTQEGHFAPADVRDFLQAKSAYGEAASYTIADASLSEPGQPAEMAETVRITPNLLALLGIAPQLGRDFRADENTPGRDRVVILSQRTWKNRFGSRTDIVGRTIRVDGESHEVIGVMPQIFNDWRHLGWVDLFRPLTLTPTQQQDRSTATLRLLFRRSSQHSRSEATGYIANFGAQLAADHPDANAGSIWRTVSLHQTAAGKSSRSVVPMLIGLSGFVLLIACSNLANLLLARTMGRAREFAVRAALGASRMQLLRPLLAEALLLALGGGVCAIFIALWFRDWAAARSTGENGEQVVFTLDWNVAGWAFAASVVTALAFGIAPALFALRLNPNDTLKSGGRGMTGGRGHQRFRQFLIVGQFALAMVLLAGAGLFIRGLHDLNNRRSGWASEQLVTGSLLLPAANYSDPEKIAAFQRLALERLSALPGVASASLSSHTPFFNWAEVRKFVIEGRDRPRVGLEPAAVVNSVSPHYFDTFGTRIIAGRAFDERDSASATKVLIVSQSTARALFGSENPLGRRLAQVGGAGLPWGEIVGVAADIESVVAEARPVYFQVYQPMAQEPRRANELALRTSGAAASTVVERVRAAIAELDADLPVRKLQAADDAIYRFNYQLRVLRDVLGAIASLGLGLAALGIYGIISRTMAQRQGEFAIRLALGASIANLTRMVLASGVKLALLGSLIGLTGAFGVAQVIAFSFPAMQTNGPVVLAGTTLLLVAIALLACWLPARRAGKVDAMTVLRAE